MKYQSVMDLHTHTVASGHAYCTLREMAKAASDKGLELLGITEHAPKMPGTCLRKPWKSWTWSLQAFMCHVSNRAADRRIQKPILML